MSGAGCWSMTIAEIAKLAGVSIGTVDRVLHNRGRVAPKTVETIMAIIDEYGYQPNAFARNLKLSKTYTVGVLPPAALRVRVLALIYNGSSRPPRSSPSSLFPSSSLSTTGSTPGLLAVTRW